MSGPVSHSEFTLPPAKPTHGWSPPETAWSGRFLFAGCGAGLTLLAFVLAIASTELLSFDQGGEVLQAIALSLPWLGGVFVLVMRVRAGKTWRWLSYAIGALAMPVVAVLLAIALWFGALWWFPTDFDAVAWRSADPYDDNTRAWMVDDLLEQDRLRGRHVSDVEALLGPDDGRTGADARCRRYYLGGARHLFGGEELVLHLSEDGIVTSTELWFDD